MPAKTPARRNDGKRNKKLSQTQPAKRSSNETEPAISEVVRRSLEGYYSWLRPPGSEHNS
jgi:hypothetical protein